MCSTSTKTESNNENSLADTVFINTESLVHNDKTGFENKIIMQKDGQKTLYYRLALHYALSSSKDGRNQISKGFKLERRYFPVNDDVDLIRDSYGRYVTTVGSLIQIVLKVSTFKKRHHLVLIDECPSAMEPLPEEHTEDGDDTELGYGLQWYQHQSIRQNHLEIYSTILYPGEHIYTYYARTTNTGMFHVPSARVEEMYNRHYGMSSKDMLVVRGVNEDIYSIVAEDDQLRLSKNKLSLQIHQKRIIKFVQS